MAAPVVTEGTTRPRVPTVPRGKMRADIQALRALAVMLVVVGHFWPGRLPGGYVGVDVFFVISGFLITTHLFGEMTRTGRVSFSRFYVRRAKRLLPAAIVVSVASLAAVVITMPATMWRTVAEEVFAATVYVENWVLAAKSVDYSAQSENASTVQHYWSLSVEEQFYLMWPLLLLALLIVAGRIGRPRTRVWLAGITVVSILSFVYAIWETSAHRSQAYFVTPTRIWEFGAGALLAVLALRSPGSGLPSWLSATLQWLGLALIMYSALTFGDQTPFPGPLAIVPVVGTALVIAVGTLSPRDDAPWMFRPRPIQFLGDVSYSLYLWHWPLIIIAPFVLHGSPGLLERIVLVVIAIALSYLSKRLIEDPGRTKFLSHASGRRVLVVFAGSIAVVGLLSAATIASAQAIESRQTQELRHLESEGCFGAQSLDPGRDCDDPYAPARVDGVGQDEAPWFDVPECATSPDPITVDNVDLLTVCDFSEGRPDAPVVWLIGDSHAEQWNVNVFALAKKHRWVVKESLLGGCPLAEAKRVAFNGEPSNEPDVQQRCLDWSAKVSQRVTADRADLVLVATFSAGETIDDGSGRDQLEQYHSTLGPRIKEWSHASGHVVFIHDTPLTLDHSTPQCLAFNSKNPLACANPRAAALVPDPAAHVAKASGAAVIDLSDQFCDASRCYAVIGGVPVYFDRDHVTRSYIRSTLPVFTERLAAVVGDLSLLSRRQ